MDLDTLRTFLAVTDHGGVLAAARALELPKQTVSRRIAALEDDIGVPLFARERRPLELTPAGATFAIRARGLIAAAEAAVQEARAELSDPRGVLRIAAPQLFTREFLAPVITGLVARHPALNVRVVARDDLDPAVPWNYDAVVWIGEPPDVHWRARTLGEAHNVLCAAPRLLDARGHPGAPEDLAALPCVDYHRRLRRQPWILRDGDGRERAHVLEPRIETNEPAVALDAALAGIGVAHLPAILVRPHLDAGRLVRVLPGWSVVIGPVLLLVRSHANPPARVQALLRAISGLSEVLARA